MTDTHQQSPAGLQSPAARRLVFVCASLLTLGSVVFALELFRAVGLLIYNEQFLAGMMALAMPLVFLTQPARVGAERKTIPGFDWVLAALSFLVGAYLTIRFPDLSENMTTRPLDGLIVAAFAIPIVIEALRRTVGMARYLLGSDYA